MPESGGRAFQAEGTASAMVLRPAVFEELQGDLCVCVCVCVCVLGSGRSSRIWG